MITIERVLEILKADANFRHIKQNDQTDSTWTDVQFDALSYDSRTVSPMTLFLPRVWPLKGISGKSYRGRTGFLRV